MKNPYWLIREKGAAHGVDAVDFDDAITSEKALQVFHERNHAKGPEHVWLMQGLDFEAVVVTLTYDENNQPHVEEVK